MTQIEIPIIGKVKHPQRWLVGLMTASTLVVGTTITYNIVTQTTNKQDITQLTVPVAAKNVTLRITTRGKVVPVQSVNISPKNPGVLAQLYVEQGARVQQGQIIARMDIGDLQAQILQYRANLTQSQAKANYTTKQVKRYQYLYQQGAEKKQLLDQAISEDKSARAAVKEAQAQLAAAEVKLQDTVIRAPFSGIVTQKYANIGAFVTPTTSASSDASATSSSIVAVARGLEVLAQVPEADIGRINQEQQVEIVADAYRNKIFQGSVRLIAPEAVLEQGVTSFQVRVALKTGQTQLRSGMNVDLTFLGDNLKNTLVVPTVAIIVQKGQHGVLIPDAQQQPKFRPVTLGSTVDEQTQVIRGLQAGERVFVKLPKVPDQEKR